MIDTKLISPFFLGNGGIGDFLLFLATFYDNVEKANIIFLANNVDQIKEVASLFTKLDKKLIVKNDFGLLAKLYYDKNCVGKGILPKDLNYSNWYKVDPVQEYGLKLYPEFVKLFEPNRDLVKNNNKKQLFLQVIGSSTETKEKRRELTIETAEQLEWDYPLTFEAEHRLIALHQLSGKSYKEIFQIIRGSDLVIGVDSFVKTFSALCGIKTIVYENIYSENYLNQFKDRIDYGHYIFLFPWKNIELRQQ
jgi:hypothetical protein